MAKKVEKDVTIEELVIKFPESVKFLMDKGIKCIACGEPVWGTLEENAKEKGMDDDTIEEVVEELNEIISEKEENKEES
jgi:iron-sulfur cluster repair protein YtfE (RIC family)